MPATILLCALLTLAVAAAVRHLVRRHREGKFLCGGNCGDCNGCDGCKRYKPAKREDSGAEISARRKVTGAVRERPMV